MVKRRRPFGLCDDCKRTVGRSLLYGRRSRCPFCNRLVCARCYPKGHRRHAWKFRHRGPLPLLERDERAA